LEARRPITEDAFRGAFDKEAPELSTKLLWGEKEFLELGVELGVEGLFWPVPKNDLLSIGGEETLDVFEVDGGETGVSTTLGKRDIDGLLDGLEASELLWIVVSAETPGLNEMSLWLWEMEEKAIPVPELATLTLGASDICALGGVEVSELLCVKVSLRLGLGDGVSDKLIE
jgi:hypothetical protein